MLSFQSLFFSFVVSTLALNPVSASPRHTSAHQAGFFLAETTGQSHRMPTAAQLGPNEEIAFITQLGLMEGHVLVGMKLYSINEKDMALTHVDHPVNEIYEAILPTLDKMGIPGFKVEIVAIGSAIQSGASPSEVDAIKASLLKIIHRLRAQHSNPAKIASSVNALIQIAAAEYDSGVADGHVVEDYEYQDAYGFMAVARQLILELPTNVRATNAKHVAVIEEEFRVIQVFWPDIVGRMPISASTTTLLQAAAKIEAAATNIK